MNDPVVLWLCNPHWSRIQVLGEASGKADEDN